MRPALDERDRIRAAMDRIFDGTPERSNGALTIVALALAIEAGVPQCTYPAAYRPEEGVLRQGPRPRRVHRRAAADVAYLTLECHEDSSLQPRSTSGQADWVTSEEMPANSSRPLAVRVREDQAALWEGTESDALSRSTPKHPPARPEASNVFDVTWAAVCRGGKGREGCAKCARLAPGGDWLRGDWKVRTYASGLSRGAGVD
jgi:hypothetical protein